ncbi:hypothetical protein GIB67_041390 [Kingdonia uniflora]|uniref:non-specific serine/threonine protein kinase n=1 Tax=Kingdonia uniflora TaxID=39325 RepID=A0A7J7LRC1_9MAGN|nr:hypothetical protein GIB67_041390 [Kingdonia uniflora]
MRTRQSSRLMLIDEETEVNETSISGRGSRDESSDIEVLTITADVPLAVVVPEGGASCSKCRKMTNPMSLIVALDALTDYNFNALIKRPIGSSSQDDLVELNVEVVPSRLMRSATQGDTNFPGVSMARDWVDRMGRYNTIKEVGNGTFESVWRAINKLTGEIVTIKKMKRKYYSWDECINLQEVKSLRKMNHPNIVKLKEVIREYDILYFVFEYMECNLYQLIKDRGKLFSETEVRNWCFQVFHALSYMHQNGYFHRDLKPENLLVTKEYKNC